MGTRTKSVVLCIDAADFEIISLLVSKGILKNFEKIITHGVFGSLKSTLPPFTAPAWTSFFTGVYPEKHGIYDFIKRKENSYDVTPYTLTDLKVPAIWDLLKDHKCCIMNVPMTFPAPPLNGVLISGFPFSGDKVRAFWPSGLFRTIKDTFGSYPFYDEIPFFEEKEEIPTESFLESLLETMEKRKEIYIHFLDNHDFDLYVFQFQNLDKLQHRFWCFWDDRYIGFEKNKNLDKAIEKAYLKVDEILGEILASLNDCVLFVISDHGFGLLDMMPSFNNWLLKNGFLRVKTRQTFLGAYKTSLLAIFRTLRLNVVLNLLPKYFMRKLKKILRSSTIDFSRVDWERTVAYSLGFPTYIYLNKEAAGQEYERIRNEIIDKLSEDFNFEKIFSKDELYRVKDARTPDIIVKIREYPLQEDYENLIALPGHREEGIFIAYGPGIKKGYTIHAHIVDIGPTVLHLFNSAIPQYSDGRVLLDIFGENSEPAKREIRYIYTDREREKIMEKIKMLKKMDNL